jgi:hypothetical protein
MSKQVKLDFDEVKKIADILTNTENPDEDYDITENALAEKWGIDIYTFYQIANGIFQMIDFGISPLTQTSFVGISKGNMWLAKKEVNQQFIHAFEMRSLELLKEIEAWLCFNTEPSKEETAKLRKSIYEHVSEQLRLGAITGCKNYGL